MLLLINWSYYKFHEAYLWGFPRQKHFFWIDYMFSKAFLTSCLQLDSCRVSTSSWAVVVLVVICKMIHHVLLGGVHVASSHKMVDQIHHVLLGGVHVACSLHKMVRHPVVSNTAVVAKAQVHCVLMMYKGGWIDK